MPAELARRWRLAWRALGETFTWSRVVREGTHARLRAWGAVVGIHGRIVTGLLAARAMPRQFREVFRLLSARRIQVALMDNGFFANFLIVLDVLAHKREDAVVAVDWTLVGREGHFRYGRPGDDVWSALFEPLSSAQAFAEAPGPVLIVDRRANPYTNSLTRDAFRRAPDFQAQRQRYAASYERWVRLKNPYVLEEVERLTATRLRERFALGVHKRLGTPRVARHQERQRVRPIRDWIECTRRLVAEVTGRPVVIYLATDDGDAAARFSEAFGDQLVLRPDVQRTPAGRRLEVHRQDWGKVSLKDACDVLIDALMLARCQQVLHMSSHISTTVALINPRVRMTHIDDLLG
jgi:hypothetical protein